MVYQANNCDNRLNIIGPMVDLAQFAVAVEGEEKGQPVHIDCIPYQVIALNRLIPIPDDLSTTNSYRNFAENEWGVKHGIWGSVKLRPDPATLWYRFQTMGGPPQLWLIKASRQFPALSLDLEYIAGSNPEYRGRFIYQAGRYLKAEIHKGTAKGNREQHIEQIKFSEQGADLITPAINHNDTVRSI